MEYIITEQEIEKLISERKIIPADFHKILGNVRIKGGHKECSYKSV
ncbi:hypothetical protein [Methanoplanus limicola]|nr:hypothetical protein [Methanoplanus limicola]